MKLLIFGSTGTIGRQLVEQALDQGHTVTAFVRNPSKITVEHKNPRLIQGDVMDLSTVEKAMYGHDTVLCTLGAGNKGVIRSEGTKHIIDAMKKLAFSDSFVRLLWVQATAVVTSIFCGNILCLACSSAKPMKIINYRKNM